MTKIEPIAREEMQDLISAGVWGKLTEIEASNLEEWLGETTRYWAGMVGDDLLCVYGIAPLSMLSDRAYFWVWTTDRLADHEFIFVRRSQIVVKELLKEFTELVGHCKAKHKHSQRWLRWLGAEFEPCNGDLIPFVIEGR